MFSPHLGSGDLPTEKNPTAPNSLQPINLSADGLDHTLERSLDTLASAVEGNSTTNIAEAVVYLESLSSEPEVAYRLAEVMMTAKYPKARELAEMALIRTQDQAAKDLLRSEYLIREISKGGGIFGGDGPDNPDQLVADLIKVREHPLVAARLVETITKGLSGDYYAANVLQNTPDKKTQVTLKLALKTILEGGKFDHGFERNKMWQLPRALKFSDDPEVHSLIVKAFKEGHEAFGTNNLRYSAACALGSIKTQEVKNLIIDSVFDAHQDWNVRRGIAEAIKEQNDPSINARIVPLIEGSVTKTAWLLAGEKSNSLFGQVLKWVSLMNKSNIEKLHDVQVQVAIALQEHEPLKAMRALNTALMDRRDSFKHKCCFFAAADALAAIKKSEAAV